MYYMLITVSPVGTMTCQLTMNYMAAEEAKLDPGYFAFVVEAKSFQIRHSHGLPNLPANSETEPPWQKD